MARRRCEDTTAAENEKLYGVGSVKPGHTSPFTKEEIRRIKHVGNARKNGPKVPVPVKEAHQCRCFVGWEGKSCERAANPYCVGGAPPVTHS